MTLQDIAKKMCAKGKGILAADERQAQWIRDLKVLGLSLPKQID